MLSKILAIAYEKHFIDKLFSEARMQRKCNDVTVVSIDVDLTDTDFICRDFREYLPKVHDKNAIMRVQSWIKNWSTEKIIDGKNFKELISYDGVSLWWFIEYYYFYTLYFFNIGRYIEILKPIIKKEMPNKLIFVSDGSLFSKVLETFAKANGLDTIIIRPIPSLRKKINSRFSKFFYNQGKRYWKTLLTVKETVRSSWVNILNSLLSTKSSTKTDELPKIIVISPERFWGSIVDSKTGETKKGFLLTNSVLQKLAEQYNVLNVSFHPFLQKVLGLKILLEEKKAYPNILLKTADMWDNKKVKNIVKTAKMNLNKTWNILKESESFQSSLTYDGVPLWSILQDMLSGLFSMELPEAVRWIETMNVMIDKEKPAVIVLPGEYCSFLGYASMIVGNKKNVPIVAIQHGVFTTNSLEYEVKPNEKGEDVNSKMGVIPTKLAVYGDYSKNVLETFSYPLDRLVVTGHPDYDVLVKLENFLDKKKIVADLGINSNHKIITFTTQSLWSMKSREKIFRAVVNATKDLQDTTLLIKPHPSEDEAWHKELLKELGANNAVVVDRHYCTPKTLFVCDLMITSYSTTAMEAMVLNKPVITIDLEDETENFPYAKSGATIGVFDAVDLLPAINDVFTNEHVRRKLAENRKNFLSNHIFKTDGLASDRIVKLISGIVASDNTCKTGN